jgi:hypothetical protein
MILELHCCSSLPHKSTLVLAWLRYTEGITKMRDSFLVMFFELRHFELLKCYSSCLPLAVSLISAVTCAI